MKKLWLVIGGSFLFLVGCGDASAMELVNTQEINSSFEEIMLDYDADDLEVHFHEEDQIILQEYMNIDKEKYYASIEEKSQRLKITEGKRPLKTSFQSRIELTLPTSYQHALSLHSTSGKIELNKTEQTLSEIDLDTTSGKITICDNTADSIILTSTSGTIQAKRLKAEKEFSVKSTSGSIALADIETDKCLIETSSSKTKLQAMTCPIDYISKNGSLKGTALIGGGSFEATGDGAIQLEYAKIDKDIKMNAKNGDLAMTCPPETSCKINARTKDGVIHADQSFDLSGSRQEKSGSLTDDPAYQVTLATRNGDIQLKE